MRKVLALLLAALMLFAVVACTDDEPSSSAPVSGDVSTPENSDSTSAPDNTVSTTSGSKKPTDNKTTTAAKPTTSVTATSTTDAPVATTTKAPGLDTSGNWEKPVTINTAILYNKKSSSFDATAEARRKEILNTPDTLKPQAGGLTFYVSYRGNDQNNGMSKNTPWKTPQRVQMTASAGDIVLFERGGVYRNVSIKVPNGVSLGAYGSGAKPQLLGSDKNYADTSLWTKHEGNIWKVTVPAPSGAMGSIEDIGNIVFDNGKDCTSPGKKLSLKYMKANNDFYFDAATNTLYLYSSKGNPGGLYDSIEVCPSDHIVRMSGKNHTIENLCVKYTGGHGISSSASENITIRGCEVGWIGGAMLNKTVRYGNGIEFYGNAKNNLVENNWVYQCYDAGYTNQGEGWHDNLTIKGNLMEYSLYNIEVWTVKVVGQGGMRNCTFEDNYLRFAGFGFSSKAGRIGSNTSVVGNISMYTYVIPCENTIITNNVLDTSYRHLTAIAYPNDSEKRGPTIKGNTWIQQPFSNSDSVATVGQSLITKKTYTVNSKADLEAGVAAYDTAPKAVIFETAK